MSVEKLQIMPTKIVPPDGGQLRLDIGCGDNKQAGFFGIDMVVTPATDFILDVRNRPWPIDDAVVDAIYTSHFLEHLDGMERINFFEECWRVLKFGSQITIIVPYWSSMRSVQDPFHKWPPLAETSFLYFNRGWRETNKLSHYPITCNFDFGYGHAVDSELQLRHIAHQQHAIKYWTNAATDLHVTMTKAA